jgi:hypothetical protein
MEIEQQAQLELLKAQATERVRLEELALEKWKAELDAEVKLTIANKPESNVQALQDQIRGLVDNAAATPEVMRDGEGRAVGVTKGAKVYGIKRGDNDEVIGLEDGSEEAQAPMTEQIRQLTAYVAAKPRIVRDDAGEVVGVEKAGVVHQVERDNEGRPVGLV